MCTQHTEELALPGRRDQDRGHQKQNRTDKTVLDHVENPTERYLKDVGKTGDSYIKIQAQEITQATINYRKNNYTI